MICIYDTLRHAVATHDTSENIDQNRFYFGVFQNNAESILHPFGICRTTHVEEVGRFAPGEFNHIHRCHCQTGSIHHTAYVSVEIHKIEIVLAGFYEARLSFAFPMAFMKEARFRIAAEFKPEDVVAVTAMIADGRLSLDGLITHRRPATEANDAYPVAFGDSDCLKMILDWRHCA